MFRDAYILPRVDSPTDTLKGAKYLSILDLRSGYWKIGTKENFLQ